MHVLKNLLPESVRVYNMLKTLVFVNDLFYQTKLRYILKFDLKINGKNVKKKITEIVSIKPHSHQLLHTLFVKPFVRLSFLKYVRHRPSAHGRAIHVCDKFFAAVLPVLRIQIQ